jgi:hypothetical protein
MQYILLIYGNEQQDADRSPEDMKAEMPRWFAYTNKLKESGAYVAGDALQPTMSATTLRRRRGELMTTDGPFAETKEQLGGFYIINVPNLDDALRWAAKMPNIERGSVEVRPIMVFE